MRLAGRGGTRRKRSPSAETSSTSFLGRRAVVHQWQFDVMQGSRPRQQIERLEHEPYLAITDIGQLIVVHAAHRIAVEVVASFGRRVQTTDQVHECGFAGA